jgi:hypothetical protein
VTTEISDVFLTKSGKLTVLLIILLILCSLSMKALFGSIVVDGRGKLGGHVYSKNRGGSYVRSKVTPVNPQSTAQSFVRSIMTFLTQAWKGLSEANRTAWNSAVQTFARTDVFGNVKNPSGLALYMRLNGNLLNAGAATISVPPAAPTAPEPVEAVATAAAGAGTLSIAFAPSPVPANTAYIVEATEQVSPGVSFVKNKYRRIAQFPAADATPTSVFTEYVARFGALIAGKKIGFRYKSINLLTGMTSGETSELIIVSA